MISLTKGPGQEDDDLEGPTIAFVGQVDDERGELSSLSRSTTTTENMPSLSWDLNQQREEVDQTKPNQPGRCSWRWAWEWRGGPCWTPPPPSSPAANKTKTEPMTVSVSCCGGWEHRRGRRGAEESSSANLVWRTMPATQHGLLLIGRQRMVSNDAENGQVIKGQRDCAQQQ